jgi:diguanylate cyclase (GGDEF)-like protein/PAS domain S-box-containing protein
LPEERPRLDHAAAGVQPIGARTPDPGPGQALLAPEHFRSLIDGVELVAIVLDPQGRLTYCNSYLLRLTGWDLEEVLGGQWFERFVPAGEREQVEGAFRARIRDGTLSPVSMNHIASRHDERRLLRWNNTVLRAPDGEILGVASLGEDITERLQAEEALSVQSAFFRQLFEKSPVGIVILDNSDLVVDANPGFERLFGYRLDEVRGRHLNELIAPAGLESEASGLSQLVLEGSPVRKETVRRDKHGDLVDVAVLGCPVQLDERQIGVYGIYLDLRERRRAEEALRHSEERYALAARGANDGLWDWDLRTNEVYFSARWAAMLGHREQELGSGPEEWLARVHPGDRARLRRELRDHLQGGSPHFQCEHRVRHRDGSFRWMLSRGLAVRDERGEPSRMAGSQTDITERKLAESRLLHDALHDDLTALPNRALFLNRLEMAIERLKRDPTGRFAVLFLDLDRFKVINDSLGHRSGDELLRLLSGRLHSVLRVIDTVARLGGDEFGFLLEGVRSTRQAIGTANRILEELERPFVVAGQEVFTSASIGVAISRGNYEAPEEVLRDADIAMYRAKALGRGRYAVFDQEMHQEAMAEMQLETDLRRALDRREMVLHYQPMVCLNTGTLCGFEALVRWSHPERGLLLPEQFIGTAEETGLVVPLGHWVIDEACRQVATWQRRFGAQPQLAVSVNLSARQLAQADLVDGIRRCLSTHGTEPHRLKLEITESVLMKDAAATQKTLFHLRNGLGVRLMIDDFGTGYSSLSYLHQFPVDMLKIDRSFVSRMHGGNNAIVRAIVTLGQSLKMRVLAEGVESAEQLGYLRELSCEFAQGFLFSPPVDADRAEGLLRKGGFELPPR